MIANNLANPLPERIQCTCICRVHFLLCLLAVISLILQILQLHNSPDIHLVRLPRSILCNQTAQLFKFYPLVFDPQDKKVPLLTTTQSLILPPFSMDFVVASISSNRLSFALLTTLFPSSSSL